MNRTSIINALLTKIKKNHSLDPYYTPRYLEIGIYDGRNFESILTSDRTGVDPELSTWSTHGKKIQKTSDEFFAANSEVFDLIFIDGLHTADQVERDIRNSLKYLANSGYIVCHDMSPQREEHQTPEYHGGIWNGDGWKALAKIRSDTSLGHLKIFTVDTDYGCTVITQGTDANHTINLKLAEELTWTNLEKNRVEWLNLISVSDFFYKEISNNSAPSLDTLLSIYVGDPSNAEANFLLARYYDGINQKAAAVSYYIRSAERAQDVTMQYECLVLAAMCFEWQGTRGLSVRGLLQRAISLLSKRPEAHFLLARWYEREKTIESWVNCYTQSCLALQICDFTSKPLRSWVDYPGEYGLHFEKAVAGWWVGQCAEARDIFIDLHQHAPLAPEYRAAVINNLAHLGQMTTKEISSYTGDSDRLKVKFAGAETIEQNYSEAYQDLFVLSCLDGKRNGRYLEIGSGRPFHGNNSALLETKFDWTGISVDLDQNVVNDFNSVRKNKAICADATALNYVELLKNLPQDIDYLQIDVDPPEISLAVLKKMAFDHHRFAVITFEHDAYSQVTDAVRKEAREFLKARGYLLLVPNVAPDHWRYYEDWWVHPKLVSAGANILRRHQETTISGRAAMLNV